MKILLLLLLMAALAHSALTTGEIAWRTEYESALAEAKESGKPLLLDFSASWCGPCRAMEATTFADSATQRLLQKYVTVRIDFDQNAALVGKYHVEAIPQLILLNRFGETVATSAGYLTPAQLAAWLVEHDREAFVAVSRAQQAQQKMQALDADLHSPDAARRAHGLDQVLESYVAKDDDATAAELILKNIAVDRPADLLSHLDDARLAVRIFVANLLAAKLGPDFSFDPWESPENRASAIEAVRKKLAPPVP